MASDAMASTISMFCQSNASGSSPSTRMRSVIANAATLGAPAISSVTAVGEPWYTSGTHMWNGAAPSLNARPATMNTTPNTRMVLLMSPVSIAWKTLPRSSEPVAPYSIDMPYSSRPEASAPRMKYFMPDSDDTFEPRRSATSAYEPSDSSSRPRYRVRKLLPEIITIWPSSVNSARM